MLSRLSISNYALIESLEMHPHKALNIITGETGAGKSIMLGAVGLLLGNRADTKVLYDLEKKCIIEGEFNISVYELQSFFEDYDLDYENVTLIRREITPKGKSRAFVNDTPVTLDILKELGTRLMDIHSQHETLQLGSAEFQLSLIDNFAETQAELAGFNEAFEQYRQAKDQLDELVQNANRIAQESDYNSFLLNELVEAALQEEEQESLEEELKLLEHAEEIKTSLNQLLLLLDRNEQNVAGFLGEAALISRQISAYGEALSSIDKRLNETSIEITDILREIEHQESLLEVDSRHTEDVRERISMIYHLQNKHHVDTIAGLLEIQRKLEEATLLASNLDEEIDKTKKLMKDAEKNMLAKGSELSHKRKAAFGPLSEEITRLLYQLGMPDAKLVIAIEEKSPARNGLDKITINFSANKGVEPAPLSRVASGGEFSRLMFCFKYVMASKAHLPTMVFDEIDAGISGEVALQMGNMIQEMASNHQVIAISHLPQIAARGEAHYFVYKDHENDRAVSKIKVLNDDEKIEAVARMISGDSPSESAYQSARELIEL